MTISRHLLGVALFAIISITTVFAQEEKNAINRSPAPAVTALAYDDQVRFTAPGTTLQMRLEVFSENGEKFFDSDFRDGSFMGWNLQNKNGEHLGAGLYYCVVTVKDLSGHVSQRFGTASLGDKRVLLESGDTNQITKLLASSTGFVTDKSALTILHEGEAEATTVIAHDGSNGEMVVGRGDLIFRIGDFFAGKAMEQLRLTAEGNLGVGVAKPEAKLDVAGVINAREGIRFPDGTLQTTAAPTGKGVGKDTLLATVTGDGTTGQITKWTNGPNSEIGDSIISEASGQLTIGSSGGSWTIAPNLSTAKVGIHGGPLYLQTAAQVGANLNVDALDLTLNKFGGYGGGSQNINFFNYDSGNNVSRGLVAQITGGQPTDQITGSGFLSFGTAGASASTPTERMRIDTSGNVGIGTATPNSPLTVAGRIESTSGGIKFPDGSTQTSAANNAQVYAKLDSSNSGADNKTALDIAIMALPAEGGTVILPASASSFLLDPLTIANRRGFIITGQGKHATTLQSTTSSQAIITLINCRDSAIRDLSIHGNPSAPPPAAIVSRVQGATDRQAVYELEFSNLIIDGGDYNPPENVPGGFVDGIVFNFDPNGTCPGTDAASLCDANNEQHTIQNVEISHFSGAGISISGSNSLFHKIIGGYIHDGKTAIKMQGGSFSIFGTRFGEVGRAENSGYIFDFQAPISGTTGGAGYFHSSNIIGAGFNACGRLLHTAAAGGPILVYFDNIDFINGRSTGNQILFESIGGVLSIVNSRISPGVSTASISITDPTTNVILRDSTLEFDPFFDPSNVKGRLIAQGIDVNSTQKIAAATNPRVSFTDITATSYTVKASDSLIRVTTGSNTVNIALPTSNTTAGLPEGFVIIIKKVDSGSGNIVINTSPTGNQIEGGTYTISGQWSFVTLAADTKVLGTWYVISKG
jgi:hypothetical protein